jgi:hypothetical protein
VLNTKRNVVTQETKFIITYDDGHVFDGSIGVGLEEIIDELPEHARARDHYNDLLHSMKKLRTDEREKFCRANVMAMIAMLRGEENNQTGDIQYRFKSEEDCAEYAWKACEKIWYLRYPTKNKKRNPKK